MKIVNGNPKTAVEKFYAKPTRVQLELYNYHITNLPSCKHLRGNDTISFMITMHVLAELINPQNLLSNQIWFWREEAFKNINN